MISINTSYQNLVNQRTLATNTKAVEKSMKRFSTGASINSANNDPAGFFISSGIGSTLSGMKVAANNTALSMGFLNIAHGVKSTIDDLDYAKEISNLTKSQILQQISLQVLRDESNVRAQITLGLVRRQ